MGRGNEADRLLSILDWRARRQRHRATMSSYILPDGRFSRAYAELASTGWKLNLQSTPRAGGKKKKDDSKTPFCCAVCGWKMWGKPDSKMTCTQCVIPVLAVELGAASPDAIALVERYQLRAVDVMAAAVAETMPAPLPLFEPPPSYEPTPSPSYDEIVPAFAPTESEPVKRTRSRPKGSKNKPKRGRLKGSKNKPEVLVQSYKPKEQPPILKRKRGRPPGSKNRPKAEIAA